MYDIEISLLEIFTFVITRRSCEYGLQRRVLYHLHPLSLPLSLSRERNIFSLLSFLMYLEFSCACLLIYIYVQAMEWWSTQEDAGFSPSFPPVPTPDLTALIRCATICSMSRSGDSAVSLSLWSWALSSALYVNHPPLISPLSVFVFAFAFCLCILHL
jgi:hypothetical protein